MAYVAEMHTQLVGLVHFIRHAHNWKQEDVIYLQDLYTTPEMRGAGVGGNLIKAVYDTADAMGCPTVYWLTHKDNIPAQRLYDQLAQKTDFIKSNR